MQDPREVNQVKYTVRKSVIRVIGQIWMPATTAATTYELDSYAVGNARDDEGRITRESVQRWLDTHAGDFQSVTDFEASIEDGDTTVDIPWADEDSELTFGDCTNDYDEDDER
jgi:hypothetical protein